MSDEKSSDLDQNRKGVRGQLLEREGNYIALLLGLLYLDRLQCRPLPHRTISLLDNHKYLWCPEETRISFSHWLPFSPYKLYLIRVSGGLISLISPLSSLLIYFLFSYTFYSSAAPEGLSSFLDSSNPLEILGMFLHLILKDSTHSGL